jgi:hypothetical protein
MLISGWNTLYSVGPAPIALRKETTREWKQNEELQTDLTPHQKEIGSSGMLFLAAKREPRTEGNKRQFRIVLFSVGFKAQKSVFDLFCSRYAFIIN